jgi:hypothetical protein
VRLGDGPLAGRLAASVSRPRIPLRSAVVTAALLLAAIVVAVYFGLRHVPLLTLSAVALVGAGLAHGVVRAPSALADPAARAHGAVSAWQRDQIARLVCEMRASQALKTGDDAQLAAAVAACARVR